MAEFTNAERRRYYGLRIGDLVEINTVGKKTLKGEVIQYGFMDNNRIILRLEDGTETDWVAEWCKIIQKVEDREKNLD